MQSMYSQKFRIASFDVCPDGRARLTSMAHYFQETAYHHANLLGLGYHDLERSGQVWVLARMKIGVMSMPEWNQEIVVETWPRGTDKLFALRDYLVKDSSGITQVKASTSWLVLNRQNHRPVRFSFDVLNIPVRKEGVFSGNPEKIDAPDHWLPLGKHRVLYSDLDVVGHVNNVKYIEWSLDALYAKNSHPRDIKTLDINYIKESSSNDTIELQLAEPDQQTAMIRGLKNDRETICFICRISFEKSG